MKTITTSDIAAMPVQQRIQLVEDIWDSIADMPEAIEIPDWHKEELDRRMDEYGDDASQPPHFHSKRVK